MGYVHKPINGFTLLSWNYKHPLSISDAYLYKKSTLTNSPTQTFTLIYYKSGGISPSWHSWRNPHFSEYSFHHSCMNSPKHSLPRYYKSGGISPSQHSWRNTFGEYFSPPKGSSPLDTPLLGGCGGVFHPHTILSRLCSPFIGKWNPICHAIYLKLNCPLKIAISFQKERLHQVIKGCTKKHHACCLFPLSLLRIHYWGDPTKSYVESVLSIPCFNQVGTLYFTCIWFDHSVWLEDKDWFFLTEMLLAPYCFLT